MGARAFGIGLPAPAGHSPVGIWYSLIGKWERDPPEVTNSGRSIWSTILVFCENGQFKKHDLTLRDDGQGLYMGPSDGFIEFHGNWMATSKGVEVKYRFFDSMYILRPVGEGPDTSEKRQAFSQTRDRILLGETQFGKASRR
jgi:hypothetical protein